MNKIIRSMILLSIMLIGLGLSSTVTATGGGFDDGFFKVKGKEIGYDADFGYNEKTGKDNKNEILIAFFCWDKNYEKLLFGKDYLIKKSGNEVKSYSLKYDKKGSEISRTYLDTYKTSMTCKNFYYKTFKPVIIKKTKLDATKVL